MFDNQLLIEQEQLITEYLNSKKIQNPAEREQVLTRYLASAYLTHRFEFIYYGVFGSQLRALEMLNQQGANGVPASAMEAWYEWGKLRHPAYYDDYSFERWLDYMRRMTLITTPDANVHATVFGKEFLKNIVHNSYAMDKNG